MNNTLNAHGKKINPEKDTKYTERKISAQQSTSDRMNTTASIFHLPVEGPFPVPSSTVWDTCCTVVLPPSGLEGSLVRSGVPFDSKKHKTKTLFSRFSFETKSGKNGCVRPFRTKKLLYYNYTPLMPFWGKCVHISTSR